MFHGEAGGLSGGGSGTKGSDGIAAAAPEAVSMGRLKVACAEKVGRPRAEMSGGGGSRPSLGE